MSNNEEESMEEDNNFNQEKVIRYYFQRGFDYHTILQFLTKYHNFTISYRTLLRRLKTYGMKRRNKDISQITHEAVKDRIQHIINGPASCCGSRTVWHFLNWKELEYLEVLYNLF